MPVIGLSVMHWCEKPWTNSGWHLGHDLTLTGAATTWEQCSTPLQWHSRVNQVRQWGSGEQSFVGS